MAPEPSIQQPPHSSQARDQPPGSTTQQPGPKSWGQAVAACTASSISFFAPAFSLRPLHLKPTHNYAPLPLSSTPRLARYTGRPNPPTALRLHRELLTHASRPAGITRTRIGRRCRRPLHFVSGLFNMCGGVLLGGKLNTCLSRSNQVCNETRTTCADLHV